jgi:capsule polysaccharide export protein KpsE/RkpR
VEDQVVDNGKNSFYATATDLPVQEITEAEQLVHHSRRLWNERRLLLRVTAIALVFSAAIAFIIPTRFESTVRIMPPDMQNGAASLLAAMSGSKNIPGGMAALAGSLFGLKNTGALFTDLLASRTIQDHLVDRFHLQRVYWKRYRQDARKKLAARTDVAEDRKSGVITIAVTDHDRQRARDMAQAYVDELDALVASVNTSSARRERIFIEQRLATVNQGLHDAETELGEFSSKNATLDVNLEAKAMVESAAELQGQLIAAKSELEGLQQVYSDNNVRVRSLKARIGELDRQLQKIGGKSATVESLPAENPGEIYPPLRHIPVLGVKWLDLYRRVRVQETVFELLTQQYELARIEEAKSIPTVRVIDAPNFPEEKSFPPRGLITAGGTLLGFACAYAWLLAVNKWRSMDAADPRKMLVEEIRHATVDHAREIVHRKRSRFDPAA